MTLATGEAIDVQPIIDWLLGDIPDATSEGLVLELATRLVDAGVRLTRIAAFVRTLHPGIMGRSFVWKRGVPGVVLTLAPHAVMSTPMFINSPSGQVFSLNREHRWRLDGDDPLPYSALVEQRAAGMTDYLGVPLPFMGGAVHVITYATDGAGGFSDAELDALRRVTKPLTRVAEILSLARNAANLLDVYVGHHAGERILAGHVKRGETERIHCVIWFSDLRGFTTLSAQREPEATIEILNRLFDCQVPAVEKHGGEVLKFIGDGMLAIFKVSSLAAAADVVHEALAAAREAFTALDVWNHARAKAGDDALHFGLALHVGEVGYGNIGGADRLDFTCIGPAVNLAARVEGLASKLGKRLLLTEAVAELVSARTRSLGAHAVKGVEPAPTVYELVDTWSMPPPAG